MKIEEYLIDGSENQIILTVNVSTDGIAGTKISRTPQKGITKTPKNTGSIEKTKLGTASELHFVLFEVRTTIDLELIDSQNWDSCFENLSITYTLDGGNDGEITFEMKDEDKHKSITGQTIIVNKYIRTVNPEL